jgi:L-iditol 2-dehydrogenase
MKAAYLVGPKKFELRDVPDPAIPEDGLVLEVKACGICGSDLRRWAEGPPEGSGGVIPGHEAAGVVIAVGSKCSKFNIEDRLAVAPDIHCGKCWYCRRELVNLCDNLRLLGITAGVPGGFAEKLSLSGEVLLNGVVTRIPDGLTFEHAAVSEPCTSVLACHTKINTGMGETIVVMGGGPIGCIHIGVAKSRGASVILSEPSAPRRKLAERFHPDLVVDPLTEDLQRKVRAFTDGIGADAVICANPVAETQKHAVEIVRKGGKVVLFGGLPKRNPLTTLDGNRIHYGEIEVIGSFSYNPAIHAKALNLLHDKILPADQLITHRFSLEAIGAAFETASGGDALKVLIAFE